MAAIALVINAGGDAFMLSLLKPLLDEGFGTADNDFLRIMPLIILGLMLLRGISSFVSGYCLSWVSGKVVMTMRRNLFRHMMGMPVSFFDQQSTRTLLSRITYDSEQVASSSSGALVTVVREGAYIIALVRADVLQQLAAVADSDCYCPDRGLCYPQSLCPLPRNQ